MFKRKGRRTLFCSFCRKSNRHAGKLIGGPGVYICDTCVGHCNAILEGKPGPGFPEWDTLDTQDLLAALHPSEAAVESSRGVLQDQIDVLRGRSVSWAAIGKALGITRQAAWERFS